ncbi:MAG TPA: hypothetical protein PK581_05480 [Caldisericia bacterium]|jgi:hypothetical protein|nr:hypothetical protein [Caldisericia bacterium]
MIQDKEITIFIGNMGSGKSEIAVNYTLILMKQNKRPVKLMDLDVIKPYIRIRDIAESLKLLGVDLLLPDEKIRHADMPIIPAQMMKYLYDDHYDMVIDVGGEDRGSITIAQFKDQFADMKVKTYVVINAMRPYSDTPEHITSSIQDLSRLSKLKIDGIVANSHIRFSSTWEEVCRGIQAIGSASKMLGIPIFKVAVWDKLLKTPIPPQVSSFDILPLQLHLMFPWEKLDTL